MAQTHADNLFVPEVATEVATAEFPNLMALGFPGAPFVRVDGRDSLGQEGDFVKFPRYDALSEMSDGAEGTDVTPEKLETSQDRATVQVGLKGVEITDWADLASQGDPSAEVGMQMAQLAARWVDTKLIEEAETTDVTDSVSQAFTYDVLVDAIVDSWGDKLDDIGGIVVRPEQFKDIAKLDEFQRADMIGSPAGLADTFSRQGRVRGFLGGTPVYVSNRLSTTSGSPSTYDALILKRGALMIKFQRSLMVEMDRDILSRSDVIVGDVRAAFHLLWGDPKPVIKFTTQ